MSKNTVVRGMLVPSLKNKPLDGRMDVPTLDDIVNIENPYVNFIFPVAETGMWYKVTRLTDKVIDELVIPDGEIAEYETFGEGMTDKQKEDYLLKSIAEQMYLKKDDAALEYLKKTDADGNFLKKVQAELEYLKKEDAKGLYQPKGDYLLKTDADGTFATKKELEDLENRIGEGGGGEGGNFIDAPKDGKNYARKNGLWNELVDAPSDGKAYARINGVWAPIESGNALDPMLPVLSLTIGSSIENDATIAKVAALVYYADKQFMLGNGGKMNVPYGLNVVVTFPNVDNYTTPDSVTFENVEGDISAEGVYVNLEETVNVYVSAEDGSSVDGQIVTVGKLARRPNGVYIEDNHGKLWTKDEWDGSETFSSLAIIHNEHSFGLYPTAVSKILADVEDAAVGTPVARNLSDALKDYNGVDNTYLLSTLFSTSSDNALKHIKYFKFATNKNAYLPALGELNVALIYEDEIRGLAHLATNPSAGFSGFKDTRSSTYSEEWNNNQKTWAYDGLNPSSVLISKSKKIYPFCEISEEQCLYTPEPNNYEVLGGQVSFGALRGDEISVKINAKGDEYRTPDEVHLTVQDGDNNVSLVYNLLVIDTIYINNLIADTDSIISGEMNGKAVQAIWNGVHRYLGKIVTKEDSTNELVLLDIDQNDNRYYADGSMIDLESLGTNAYFFTKIPAMSYKITQMSENIYKVQISYKHKPEGDGWKHFDEMIMPTFAAKGGKMAGDTTDRGFPVYFKDAGMTYNISYITGKYIRPIDSIDYSNLVLICCAKYGVDNDFSKVNESVLPDSFVSTGSNTVYLRNGFSLVTGVKDARFKTEAVYDRAFYANSVLGLENFFKASENMFYDGDGYSQSYFPLKSFNGSSLKDCVEHRIENGNIKIISFEREFERNYTTININGAGYIKRLIIDDFFHFVVKELGATSNTYYKSHLSFFNYSSYATHYINPTKLFKSLGNYNTTSYSGRVKIICPNRIESDREAFESLTNIWK